MLLIAASLGCLAVILATTFALAEVMASPTLPRPDRWIWILSLLTFSALAATAWYLSSRRAQHAPLNLLESDTTVSQAEIDALIDDIDEYRQTKQP